MNDNPKVYVFDDFRFDAEKLVLYHEDVWVKTGDKKTMQVLAALLLNPNKLTSHEEIIQKVWKDNPHGVTPGHIGQYIKKLRKVFTEFTPEKTYIETIKGRGYLFVGDVNPHEIPASINLQTEQPRNSPPAPADERKTAKSASSRDYRRFAYAFLILIPVLLVAVFSWKGFSFFSFNDEEEIKRVVKESQLYESLVLYKNPALFSEETLDKYWSSELDTNSNFDRRRIRESLEKLKTEGRHYGDETKCEQFEFQSVEINQAKDFAVVKTLEKWFIAVYFNDGTLQKNKYVGPYFVSYILRKIDGRWLIEKSTTARVSRPVPRLINIETVSEARPKQEFFVKITGQDFEAETVSIEVVGEGCPESRPCKVPNSALREKSKLTDTALDNVPLTLASGDFQIVVRNGDSQPSNAMPLTVP